MSEDEVSVESGGLLVISNGFVELLHDKVDYFASAKTCELSKLRTLSAVIIDVRIILVVSDSSFKIAKGTRSVACDELRDFSQDGYKSSSPSSI